MRVLLILSVIGALFVPKAQGDTWCGFAILGITIPDTALSVLAALTPAYDPYSSQPDELLQRRWNVARTQVIIEGCFSAIPTREVVVGLLDTVLDETYEEIDAVLAYTLVDTSLSREAQAAAVKAYILTERAMWGEE